MSKHIPAFEQFIEDLRAAWKALPDTEARMRKGRDLLEALWASGRAPWKIWN